MPILTGPIKRSQTEVDLVFSEDPSVKLSEADAHCGWLPKSEALSVLPDADTVRVRALDPDTYTAVRDMSGGAKKNLARCRAGILAINGDAKGASIEAWLATVAVQAPGALDLLGLYIDAISTNVDTVYFRKRIQSALTQSREVSEDPKSD